MKKILAFTLLLAMTLSMLVGCGGNTSGNNASGDQSSGTSDSGTTVSAPKEIRVGRSYDATTLDPHNGNDDGSYNIIKYL